MERQVQYRIQMYDRKLDKTFDHKFYINPSANYIDVLKQFIDILISYNLEITPDCLDAIIIGGRNPKEQKILLERVT